MASDKKSKHKKKHISKAEYEHELMLLQIELVKLQEWVKDQGLKIVCIFEGRDAAGKGGTIKRIIQSLNPRICRVVALGTPTEREKTQWYFQRYVAHLPAAGEMVLLMEFDGKNVGYATCGTARSRADQARPEKSTWPVVIEAGKPASTMRFTPFT